MRPVLAGITLTYLLCSACLADSSQRALVKVDGQFTGTYAYVMGGSAWLRASELPPSIVSKATFDKDSRVLLLECPPNPLASQVEKLKKDNELLVQLCASYEKVVGLAKQAPAELKCADTKGKFVPVGSGFALRDLSETRSGDEVTIVGELLVPPVAETSQPLAVFVEFAFLNESGSILRTSSAEVYMVASTGGVYPIHIYASGLKDGYSTLRVYPKGTWTVKPKS